MQANRKAGIVGGAVSPPTFNLVGTATKPEAPLLTDTQCCAVRPHEKPYKLPDGSGLLLEVKGVGAAKTHLIVAPRDTSVAQLA